MNVDNSIIDGCIKSDRKAQRKLYEICYGYLMSICFRYAKSEYESQELLNVGFLKVLNGLKKKSQDIPFKAWVRKVMINSIIDEFRKTKNYKQNTILVDYQQSDIEIDDEIVVNEAESKFNIEEITNMVRNLPPVTQKVFNLCIVDGYSYGEVAKLLKVSESTCRWHISSARNLLKEMIVKNQTKLKVVIGEQ